jgi:hypothetical protein
MKNKIILPIPLICLYEGRIVTRQIKVFEVSLLRSGKPYRVHAKDINYPNEENAPYDFKYLDEDCKENILRVLEQIKK